MLHWQSNCKVIYFFNIHLQFSRSHGKFCHYCMFNSFRFNSLNADVAMIHTEISQLNCKVNQLTNFYIMTTLAFNQLSRSDQRSIKRSFSNERLLKIFTTPANKLFSRFQASRCNYIYDWRSDIRGSHNSVRDESKQSRCPDRPWWKYGS